MHKIPITQIEEDGLRAHGLDIGTPSQLSDAFRQGIAWGQNAERYACARVCEEIQVKTDKWGPMAGYCAERIRLRSNVKLTGRGPER